MFVVPNVEQNKIRADQFHPRGWAVTRGRDVEFFVPADLSLIHHPFFAQELTGTLARLGGVEDGFYFCVVVGCVRHRVPLLFKEGLGEVPPVPQSGISVRGIVPLKKGDV